MEKEYFFQYKIMFLYLVSPDRGDGKGQLNNYFRIFTLEILHRLSLYNFANLIKENSNSMLLPISENLRNIKLTYLEQALELG